MIPGGYNLEGSNANTQRLTNLILLISLAYQLTISGRTPSISV